MFDKIYNGSYKILVPMILATVCGRMYHIEEDRRFLLYSVVLLVYGVVEFIKGYRE